MKQGALLFELNDLATGVSCVDGEKIQCAAYGKTQRENHNVGPRILEQSHATPVENYTTV